MMGIFQFNPSTLTILYVIQAYYIVNSSLEMERCVLEKSSFQKNSVFPKKIQAFPEKSGFSRKIQLFQKNPVFPEKSSFSKKIQLFSWLFLWPRSREDALA
jgi:hypothetical protein